MKKISFIILTAAVLAATVSCQKNVTDVASNHETEKGLVKVVLNVGTSEVKADFLNSKITWTEGDEIAVWDGKEVRKFTLVPETTGSFQGEVDPEATSFDLVYPYSAMSETGEINVIPSAKQIIPVSATADPAALICSKAGVTDLKAGVTFENVVSLFKFTVDVEGVSKITLKGNEQINNADALTIVPEGASFAKGTYYAAVAPVSLSKISILFNAGADTKVVEKTESVNFVAGSGVNVSNFVSSANAIKLAPIASAADLNNFSVYAGLFGDEDVVDVTANVVADGNFESVKDFKGTLNGNNNKISGLTKPLFDTLSGSVTDLDVEANIEVTDVATEEVGILARSTNNAVEGAKVENVNTSGSITVNTGTLDHHLYVGGVTGCNAGSSLTDCSNSATITVSKIILDISGGTSGTNSNHFSIGGIAGTLLDRVSGSSKIALSGCTNSGSIVYANTSSFTGTNIYSCVGGVFGVFAKNHYTIDSMTNNGTISVTNAVNYEKGNFYVGGIMGWSNQGVTMTDCFNKATITYLPTNAVVASRVAGVLGVSNAVAVTFNNCDNFGDITIGTALEYAGGIVAYSTTACVLTSCDNSGDIALNAGVKYVGGVFGYTTKASTFDSCTNTGRILFAKGIATIAASGDTYNVGGILGACVNETAAGSTFVNCTNGVPGNQEKGSIWLNVNAKYYYVGGIVGNITDKPSSSPQITACTNYAEIRNTGSGTGTSYIGGLVGFCRIQNTFTVGDSTGETINCNYGDIVNDPSGAQTGSIWLGGIVGCHNKSASTNNKAVKIYYAKNYGDIKNENSKSSSASKMRFGGILGTDSSTAANVIDHCENYGDIVESVKGGQDIATILGYSTDCTISNCGIGGSVGGVAITDSNYSDYVQGTATGGSKATVSDCYFVSL